MKRIPQLALYMVVVTGVLLAQNYDPNSPEFQRPEQGVARISVLNGDVSLRRGDSGDLVAAAINAPVIVQDRLLTAGSSRAEVQFDRNNLLRVGSNGEVRFNDLQYGRYQIQIALGTVTYRVVQAPLAQVELDTPLVAVRPSAPGIYRISVGSDGSIQVTVLQGEADVTSQVGTEHVQAGSMMMVRGAMNDPEFQIVAAPQPDGWDRWNEARDRELMRPDPSARYMSPDIYGTENMDSYGRWVQDPQYGAVWAPSVPQGWAPYQAGQWVWEDYYGWTWVSSDPWGWAPYHYGRWFNGPAGWCWFPGPVYAHHYWSPALVAFFGFGHGVGVGLGFGFGNIGWIPLAPFEVFHGWWGHGSYGRGLGGGAFVGNINLAGTYRNARVLNGVTTVAANGFGRGATRFGSATGAQIRDAALVRGGVPITPSRQSLGFSGRSVNTASFPQSHNQQFFSRSQASAAQRTPVGQQGSSFSRTGQSSGASWQRFNGPQSSSFSGGRGYQPANPGYRSNPPAQGGRVGTSPSYQGGPRYETPHSGYSGQQVRINPPIVRNSGGGNSRGSSGGNTSHGSSHPAPSSHPSSHSGGGSGGGHHR